MDEKLRETTSLRVEVMNSKRQVQGKLGNVVKIRACRWTSLQIVSTRLKTLSTSNLEASWHDRGEKDSLPGLMCVAQKLFSLSCLSWFLSPVGKSNVVGDIFSTCGEKVVILVWFSWERDTKLGHLNLGVTKSPMGDSCIS